MRMARTKTELEGAMPDPTSLYQKAFHNEQVKTSLAAAEKYKERGHYILTDDEFYAVAYCAGILLPTSYDASNHTFKINKDGALIKWIEGEFIVAAQGKVVSTDQYGDKRRREN